MTRTAPMLAALLLASPLAARAEEPQKLTLDTSGWIILNTYASSGALNANDLPRFAKAGSADEAALGMGVRQSRLRVNAGIPSDGLLFDAKLKAFVELDFMGGNAVGSDDPSLPLVRLRHAWVSAAWPQRGNLSVLAGQTWGIVGGPYFAQSISHLAVPRFAGAGFLYRRAPQVRVSGELGRAFGVTYQAGALAPIDRAGVTADAASGAPGPVGERSGLPNLEARVAGVYRPEGKTRAELGVSGHYGWEKYSFAATETRAADDFTAHSSAVALDLKLELPYVQLVGGAFSGENLDILYAVNAKGVVPDAAAARVANVETRGLWGQAAVTPVAGYTLLLGAGLEDPRDATLPAASASPILRNVQYSAGALVNLTSKWRVGFEVTRYVTDTATPAGHDTFTGNQFELSTLLAL
ncbi:hypothetical protein [Anaeromyxobacter sp. Fw109-5]|uniref:hypothetical protein n=1 Tax=Anaeromyxobacter sp. (strain Fw109-5) TaxID=404589 RepID=UPI0000ED7B9B|nr:hypothetical protein [Anaeromyxobacter sp. Fw109-5]ABS24257.1 conserved hypothetical protein [Anaeromyxobacter sp. Fw109-5]